MWEVSEETDLLVGIRGGVFLEEVLRSISVFSEECFGKMPKKIKCMDGRLLYNTEPFLGIAGSGILLDFEDLYRLLKTQRNKSGLIIESHDFCGASLLAMQQEDHFVETEEHAMQWYKFFSKLIGAKHVHVEMENSLHDERVLILDGTGRFNAYPVRNYLPSHFLCSGPSIGLSNLYCMAEIQTAINIVSHHGFGKMFNENTNFFYILVFAESVEQLDALSHLAYMASKDTPWVKVHGTVIPDFV
ncbi:hypothetical protein C0584_04585 [Candidatus Parcubacteria bacterium]|nr:MAG: hypothetical protein C0584_04585 [Candidatus Parcubacteria bacterium]